MTLQVFPLLHFLHTFSLRFLVRNTTSLPVHLTLSSGSFKIPTRLFHLRKIIPAVEAQELSDSRVSWLFPLPQTTCNPTSQKKSTIKHTKEHTSVCETAQLALLEMRGPGASQLHTLMRVSCCLLKEVLEKRLQKRNGLLPRALKQGALREALIINSSFIWALP